MLNRAARTAQVEAALDAVNAEQLVDAAAALGGLIAAITAVMRRRQGAAGSLLR